MFRIVPLSIIGSFSLYAQQWYISYRFADSLRAVSKPVLHTPLLCVQWKTPDDGQRNCPKHVEFYSKNKFEKLVRLVGFVIGICHEARSPKRQIQIHLCVSAFVYFCVAFSFHGYWLRFFLLFRLLRLTLLFFFCVFGLCSKLRDLFFGIQVSVGRSLCVR